MSAEISFRIFGGVGATVDGAAARLGSRQSQRLLGYLLSRDADDVVSVPQLVDALSRPTATISAGAVHVAVRRLRTRLDPADGTSPLRTVDGGYVLDRPHFDLDDYDGHVAAAERLAPDDPRRAFDELQSALQLWDTPWGDLATEPWAEGAVRRLEHRHLSVEDRWAELAVGAAEATDLTDLTVRIGELAAAEPLREDRWESLMRALYQSGRQAEALRAFETAREHLRDELGLDPGPRLRELERRVLLQDPSLEHRRNRVRVVGAPTERFIGRNEQLVALADLSDERLVTITGFGGVGKSRLATEHLARSPREHALVELRSLSQPSRLARHVAGELGVAVHDREADDFEPLVYALDGARRLLVLDNADVAVDEVADLVVRLLAALPGLQVLATSTVPLGLAGERIVRLEPLPVPEPGESIEGTAVELVSAQLGLAGDDPTASARAHDLARRFGGLPLPLLIAASNDAPDAPSGEPVEPGADGADDAVRTALDLALGHVSAQAAQLLELLSLLPDGAGRHLIGLVDGPIGEDRQRLLRELTLASLVQAVPTETGVQFRPLEPVRSHVVGRLDERTRSEWTLAGTSAVRRLTAPAAADLWEPPTREQLDHIESERRTVLGLLSRLFVQDPSAALDLAVSADTWWWDSGRTVEGNEWVALGIETVQPDGEQYARAVSALTSTAGGVLAAASHRQALDEAVEVARELRAEQPGLLVKLSCQLAIAAGLGGDLATCDAAVAEARAEIDRHAPLPWADAELDRYHSLRFALIGRPGEGVDAALTAADRLEQLGHPASAAGAVYFASVMGRMAGVDDMSQMLRRGLDLAVSSGSRMQVALMQAELAQHQLAHHSPDAIEQLRRAAEAVERIGNTRTAAVCRRDIGLELCRLGRADEATPDLLRAARGLVRVDSSASAPALAALAAHGDAFTPSTTRMLALAARQLARGTGTPLAPEELDLVRELTEPILASLPSAGSAGSDSSEADLDGLHELLGELRTLEVR